MNEVKIKIEKGKTILLISDVIFKAVFIRRQEVLLQMLKDIFEIEDANNPISIVGYETVPTKRKGKSYRGDILVMLSDNSYIAIEMNQNEKTDVLDRNMVQLVRI